MAFRKGDLLAQKDVMRWGTGAIAAFAIAVMAGNAAGLLPEAWLAGLHSTRLAGGSFSTLRAEVDMLRAELGRANRVNAVLNTRLALVEDNRINFARRVGALEASVPMLLEALPYDADIDYNALTASTGAPSELPAEGGSVVIRTRPLFGAHAATIETVPDQPMPAPLAVVQRPEAFGLALGMAVRAGEAENVWLDLSGQIGGLLIGLRPLLAADDNGDGAMRLVAGPVTGYDEAVSLCAAIAARDIACQPTEYGGTSFIPETP